MFSFSEGGHIKWPKEAISVYSGVTLGSAQGPYMIPMVEFHDKSGSVTCKASA